MKSFVEWWAAAFVAIFAVAIIACAIVCHGNEPFACVASGEVAPGTIWMWTMGGIGMVAVVSFIIGILICLTTAKIRAWKKHAREHVDGKRIIWRKLKDMWLCSATLHITHTMVKEVENLCGVTEIKSDGDYGIFVKWGEAFDDDLMKARIGNYIARVGEEGCPAPVVPAKRAPEYCCHGCVFFHTKGCKGYPCRHSTCWDCVEGFGGAASPDCREGGNGHGNKKCWERWHQKPLQPSVLAEPSYLEFEGRPKSIIPPPKASQMESSSRHPAVPKHIGKYMIAAVVVGILIPLIWSGIDSHKARQEAVSSEWCVVDICMSCNSEATIYVKLSLSKENHDHISNIPGISRLRNRHVYRFYIWVAEYFDLDDVCREITEYVDSLAVARGLTGKQ